MIVAVVAIGFLHHGVAEACCRGEIPFFESFEGFPEGLVVFLGRVQRPAQLDALKGPINTAVRFKVFRVLVGAPSLVGTEQEIWGAGYLGPAQARWAQGDTYVVATYSREGYPLVFPECSEGGLKFNGEVVMDSSGEVVGTLDELEVTLRNQVARARRQRQFDAVGEWLVYLSPAVFFGLAVLLKRRERRLRREKYGGRMSQPRPSHQDEVCEFIQ